MQHGSHFGRRVWAIAAALAAALTVSVSAGATQSATTVGVVATHACPPAC